MGIKSLLTVNFLCLILTQFRLYRLETDPNEKTDVSKSYPEKLLEMKITLKKEVAALLKDSHIWK
jgi:hypothetical protein